MTIGDEKNLLAQPLSMICDSQALADNWRNLQKLSGSAVAGAAIKANGYGLGAAHVAQILQKAGAREFLVAYADEAVAIKDIINPAYIAILHGVSANNVEKIRNIGAIPVLNSPEQIALWKQAGGGRCHIMCDTGMNRLGLSADDIGKLDFSGLDIDIVMSHLASADMDCDQNTVQWAQFLEVKQHFDAQRFSLANSAGIMLGSDYHFDVTRPGLALYGGIARPEMADFIKPVVSFAAEILQIRHIRRGDSVGYCGDFVAPHDMRIATLSIGYADGYKRGFSCKGEFTHQGRMLPVLGRVSMDLTSVDISNARDLNVGDIVYCPFDLQKSEQLTGISQYELLTNLGQRYQRIWV